MSRPALALVAPEPGPVACNTPAEPVRAIDTAELALDMMGRAFEALALLYEIRHPGEYTAQAGKLKEYVADNFRDEEKKLGCDGLDPAAFRDAVLRVRSLFAQVDRQVADMFPVGTSEAA